PVFFDAFFEYLGRKPDAQASFDAIQELLEQGDDAIGEARSAELRRDFERGEQILRESDRKKSLVEQIRDIRFKQTFVDRASPVVDAERKRVGKVPRQS